MSTQRNNFGNRHNYIESCILISGSVLPGPCSKTVILWFQPLLPPRDPHFMHVCIMCVHMCAYCIFDFTFNVFFPSHGKFFLPFFFLGIYLFERLRVHAHRLRKGRGREIQEDSVFSTEPIVGLDFTTLRS